MFKLLNEESGYSLIEVIVSIFILTAAILPMVGMFDTGLSMATRSGNYDAARAFANMKLEQSKTLSYAQVRDSFPGTGNTTPGSSAAISTEGGLPSGFSYSVGKRYLAPPPVGTTNTNVTLTPGGTTDTGIIEVTVTVSWGSDNSYSATGVVSRGTL